MTKTFVTTILLLLASAHIANAAETGVEYRIVNHPTFYFINYEWKDDVVAGQTHFGLNLRSFVEVTNESVIVEIGFYAQRKFGDKEIEGVLSPWVKIILSPCSSCQFNLGTIDPDHQVHRALISAERRFVFDPEEGFQFKWSRLLHRGDFWLNWKERETKSQAESFEVGVAVAVEMPYFHLKMDGIAHHIDGQLTTDKTSLRNNILVAGGGPSYQFEAFRARMGFQAFESSYLLNDLPKVSGDGREGYAEIFFNSSKHQKFGLRYAEYKGANFISRDGLKPYTLAYYSYVEFLVEKKVENLIDAGFKVRSERFKSDYHSSQEVFISAYF